MSEWSKEHAWKVCIPQKGIKGSNPFSSAGGPNELPERHFVGRTADGGIYSDGQSVRQAKKLLVFGRDKCREPAGRLGITERKRRNPDNMNQETRFSELP